MTSKTANEIVQTSTKEYAKPPSPNKQVLEILSQVSFAQQNSTLFQVVEELVYERRQRIEELHTQMKELQQLGEELSRSIADIRILINQPVEKDSDYA